MMVSNEADYETTHGLSIGTVTFKLGWPRTILDLGNRISVSNISNMLRNTMLDTMELRSETIYGLAIGTRYIDLDDRYDDGVNRSRTGSHPRAIDRQCDKFYICI